MQGFFKHKTNISVIIFSFFFALFLITPVFLTIFKTPPNTVNMLVGSYYEDYYEYLSFIKQGEQGHLLISNLFTNDDFNRFFTVWWPYSVMGFIFHIFHLIIAPKYIFWIATFLFTAIIFILIFIAISKVIPEQNPLDRILAFLLVLFSVSFYEIFTKPFLTLYSFDYWYSLGRQYTRFSIAIPHHQIATILSLIGFLILIDTMHNPSLFKKTISILIISFLLLTVSPPQYILLWSAAILSIILHNFPKHYRHLFRKSNSHLLSIEIIPLLNSAIILIPVLFILSKISVSPTMAAGRVIDLSYITYPTLKDFFYSTGLILVLAVMGLPMYLAGFSYSRKLFFFLTLISLSFVLMPSLRNFLIFLGVHNLRFNTPITYIFYGTASILFLRKIFSRQIFRIIIVAAYILFSLPSLYSSWIQMQKTPYSAAILQFMHTDMYNGIRSLENIPDNKIILTSPTIVLGSAVPALSGKRVYLGRSILTLNMPEKSRKTVDFYSMKMSPETARNFVIQENIGYVLLLPYEYDLNKFLSYYNFLRVRSVSTNLYIMKVAI